MKEEEERTVTLKVENVSFYYGARRILENIRFSAEKGDFIGIIGPNGSGKTTLLRIINNLLKPTGGAVFLDGREISKMKEKEIAKRISSVPQNPTVNFDFSVWDIVMMGRYPHLGRLSIEDERDEEIVSRCMKLTNVLHLANRSITEVSGGELQRILIARALAQEAKILLLDEPTSNLDINYQIEIMDLLRDLTLKKGITVICTMHDLNLATRYCEMLILLSNGRIRAIGRPEEVVTRDNIKETFGIDVLVEENPATNSIYVIPLGPVSAIKRKVVSKS
ncbi:heme ABC transporter ATP-binding protein [Candidatus Bathyarchaeota archaeon]|nr:heme ABC transporter ATP-binding protein [Candidatus Bathyarchaeota archaeon]